MTEFPPEAPWVTAMRDHFNRNGFYRREDLERLLGKPGDSVSASLNGEVVYRSASADTHPKGGDAQQAPSLMGSAVGEAETPIQSPPPSQGDE